MRTRFPQLISELREDGKPAMDAGDGVTDVKLRSGS